MRQTYQSCGSPNTNLVDESAENGMNAGHGRSWCTVHIPPLLEIPLRPPGKTSTVDSALFERRRHFCNPIYDLRGEFLDIRLCPSQILTKVSHLVLKRPIWATYRSQGHQMSQSFYEATRREWAIWNQLEQWFYGLESNIDSREHLLKGGFWMFVVPARQLLEKFDIEFPGIPLRRWW
jgi:hypothetical protein